MIYASFAKRGVKVNGFSSSSSQYNPHSAAIPPTQTHFKHHPFQYMRWDSIMDITTTQIDHFGIVAGIFDQLGIAKVVDKKIPKLRHHK
ncbi:MAG: DUF4277 domain-containing protein, partial [Thermotogota bacterium]|nr:DUF4277 domain-containing protein [Thermotogota bacterium]